MGSGEGVHIHSLDGPVGCPSGEEAEEDRCGRNYFGGLVDRRGQDEGISCLLSCVNFMLDSILTSQKKLKITFLSFY